MSLTSFVAAASSRRRRLRPVRRMRLVVLLFVAASPLTLGVAPAYSWVADTFVFNNTLFATIPETNIGTNDFTSRAYIEAWRPLGTDVTLCYWDPYGENVCDSSNNASDNPVKWNIGALNSRAFCENYSGVNVNPFTCQTTEPS